MTKWEEEMKVGLCLGSRKPVQIRTLNPLDFENSRISFSASNCANDAILSQKNCLLYPFAKPSDQHILAAF